MSIVRTMKMFSQDVSNLSNALSDKKLRFSKESTERDKHGTEHKGLTFTLDLSGLDAQTILESAAEHIWIRTVRKNFLNTLGSSELKQWSGRTIKAVDHMSGMTALQQARRENQKLIAMLKEAGYSDEQIDEKLSSYADELE